VKKQRGARRHARMTYSSAYAYLAHVPQLDDDVAETFRLGRSLSYDQELRYHMRLREACAVIRAYYREAGIKKTEANASELFFGDDDE
jgi:hypothetical protein